MFEKVKKVMKYILGAIAFVAGILFLSGKNKETKVPEMKDRLNKSKKKTDNVVERIAEAEELLKKVQLQLEGDIENAKKNIKIPDNVDDVVDGLNDILNTIRSNSKHNGQSGCNGCAGRP